MTLEQAKFISSVNWVEHKLSEDLKYDRIDDCRQRLIEIQEQLKQALEDFTNGKTY